jgi:DNA-binding MarR family transcriptional regulator
MVGLLLALMGAVREALDAEAAGLGLTPRQAMALLHLSEPIPMRDLATCLRCDASNVTALADGLEARGLVERVPGPLGADRRVKRLVLTEQGAAARVQLRRQLAARDSVLSALDAPSRRELAALIGRMMGGVGG